MYSIKEFSYHQGSGKQFEDVLKMWRLFFSTKTIQLKKESTDLLKKVNDIEAEECHFYFNYNRFKSYKPNITKDNILDNKISDEVVSIILAIVEPIYKVKQEIYRRYQLET